jgi:uncharacterized protein (TIRG00374 family)
VAAWVVRKTLLGLALGIAVLAFVLWTWGGKDLLPTLRAADRGHLLRAMLVFSLQIPLLGVRWWVGLRLISMRADLLALIRASSGAGFLNFFGPGHLGEPLAAHWLETTGRGPGPEAFGVLVATKAVATMAAFVTLGATLAVIGTERRLTLALLILGLGTVTLAAWVALVSDRFSQGALRWVARALRPFPRVTPFLESAERIAHRFRSPFQIYSARPAALAVVLFISLVKMGVVTCSIREVYASVGHSVGWLGALFMQGADSVGHLGSIWVPGDLGVQELVLTAAATSALSVPGPQAAAAAVLQKLVLTAHVLLCGLTFLVLAPFDPPRKPTA